MTAYYFFRDNHSYRIGFFYLISVTIMSLFLNALLKVLQPRL